MKKLIRKYTLQNAVKFDGKPNPKAVLGKVLSENPSLRSNIADVQQEINAVSEEVSQISVEDQHSELQKLAPELLREKKHTEKWLPKLKKTKKVSMRFEPSPSGALHIGHAYVLGLNGLYCREYKGALMLRIGDTNPENIYKPAYKLIEEDAQWLVGIHKIIYQSDRLPIYYKYMEKLLDLGKAYVCTCDNEQFKVGLRQGHACPCRSLSIDEQKERWAKMHAQYKQGEAVARLKTDLQDKNPAMRDFPIFRINETRHPRTKDQFRVWPLMNMSVAVDDIEFGMTHVIRAKDHADNAKRQAIIFEYLGKKFHDAMFVGRINFKGFSLSASLVRAEIEKGEYSGWDDIQLPFLPALRKRGYQAEAFLKYAVDVGMSLTDKTVSREEFFKTLNAFNKEIIDPEAHRYFFVENPKRVKIVGAPKQTIELDLHPDNRKGGRKFTVHDEFYVAEQDFLKLQEGKLYRLMDCLNFRKKGAGFVFDSLDYETFKEKGSMIMHWASKGKDMELLMPDASVRKGIVESNLNPKIGDIVQLERVGFARCDSRRPLRFWFAHR